MPGWAGSHGKCRRIQCAKQCKIPLSLWFCGVIIVDEADFRKLFIFVNIVSYTLFKMSVDYACTQRHLLSMSLFVQCFI